MNALPSTDTRFVPATAQDYSRRAKHLAWVIERPLQESQELLARAYGYGGAHELRAVIESNPAVSDPGLDWAANVGRLMRMETEFGNRLLHVLAGGDTREHLAGLAPRDWLARDIGLTDPWPEHKRAFLRLRNSLLLASGDEPAELRGATPLDYGRAYKTGAGEYTIALTAAGQAVRDVLGRWYEDEEGQDPISNRAQRARIAALRGRHSGNPWLVADSVLSMGEALSRNGYDASEAWEQVRTEAQTAIALFERILATEQCAKYAGAKLISSGFGYGNEAYSYPSVLYYAGVAALNTDHLREAIGYLERAYMTDPRDGAGARFALVNAYAQRAARDEPPATWDELTFGQVLRATALLEAGDWNAGVEAIAFALVERLWQEFNNGYEHAPGSLAGLLKAAAPVGNEHTDAWEELAAIASTPAVHAVVKTYTAKARRFGLADLDDDAPLLAGQIRAALDGAA